MKNLYTKAIVVMIITLCTVQLLSAQGNNYKLDGNNNGTSNSKLGFTNAANLKFITDGLVRQTISKEGDVIIENNLKVANGKIMVNSMDIGRILPPEGDSIIYFGEHTIQINTFNNRISWTPVQMPQPWPVFWTRGLTIANGTSAARGLNSMAFGNNAVVNLWADNSFAIGNNVNVSLNVKNSFVVGNGLTNNITNSFMLGWNGVTFFANPTHVGIGTTTPLTKLHVANSNGVDGLITSDPLASAGSGPLQNTDGFVVANNNGTMYKKLNFTGNSSDVLLGNGSFGAAPPPLGGPFWEMGGNNNAVQPFNNKLGTINFTDLNFIVNNISREYIRASDGFIGINTTNPQSRLHLNENNAVKLFSQWTNINTTGATATDGFLVGINSDGSAELRQQEDLPIRIFTNEGSLHEQRMIISHDASLNVPRVGIGTAALLNPRTYLHIGQDINETGFGYREWMNVGELVVADKSDNM
ncbi:MAG: left-handed beta-roll domain-containing protein, partial [Bacteroidales bacterium]|nr:left-handed beta-roll domain-containing protein [Bacteroidales bacterium]